MAINNGLNHLLSKLYPAPEKEHETTVEKLPKRTAKELCFVVVLQIAVGIFYFTSPVTIRAQQEETKVKTRETLLPKQGAPAPSDMQTKNELDAKPETTPPPPDHKKWWQQTGLSGAWSGLRPLLEDRGVSVNGTLTFDTSHGGNSDEMKTTARGLLDMQVTFDLNKLVGLEGGTVGVQYYTFRGHSGTGLAGALQTFSNIDSDRFGRMAGVWYEQWLFKRHARIKVGRVDANSEFAHVENGGEFINASMGYSPTILGLPTYPNPTNSFNLFVYPTKRLYAGVGVYDTPGKGAFMIGELGATWSLSASSLPGRIGVGGWRQTGGVDHFSGSQQARTSGVYLVADQMFWHGESKQDDNPRSIKAFVQYGQADPNVSAVSTHFGAGIAWTGALPHRDNDVFGFGPTWVRTSNHPGAGFTAPSELALESFYKLQLTPWLSVKSDLQYLRTPGGASYFKRAMIGTTRMAISF